MRSWVLSVECEEHFTRGGDVAPVEGHLEKLLALGVLIVEGDDQLSILSTFLFLVCDWLVQSLAGRSYHLVKQHLDAANVVMCRQGHVRLEVVDIVDLEAKALSLLELVSEVEAADPLGVQVVHDHLCAPEF